MDSMEMEVSGGDDDEDNPLISQLNPPEYLRQYDDNVIINEAKTRWKLVLKPKDLYGYLPEDYMEKELAKPLLDIDALMKRLQEQQEREHKGRVLAGEMSLKGGNEELKREALEEWGLCLKDEDLTKGITNSRHMSCSRLINVPKIRKDFKAIEEAILKSWEADINHFKKMKLNNRQDAPDEVGVDSFYTEEVEEEEEGEEEEEEIDFDLDFEIVSDEEELDSVSPTSTEVLPSQPKKGNDVERTEEGWPSPKDSGTEVEEEVSRSPSPFGTFPVLNQSSVTSLAPLAKSSNQETTRQPTTVPRRFSPKINLDFILGKNPSPDTLKKQNSEELDSETVDEAVYSIIGDGETMENVDVIRHPKPLQKEVPQAQKTVHSNPFQINSPAFTRVNIRNNQIVGPSSSTVVEQPEAVNSPHIPKLQYYGPSASPRPINATQTPTGNRAKNGGRKGAGQTSYLGCRVCGISFPEPADNTYRQHMMFNHGTDVDYDALLESKILADAWYKCRRCGTRLLAHSRRKHQATCSPYVDLEAAFEIITAASNLGIPHKCGICSVLCPSRMAFRKHAFSFHKDFAHKILIDPDWRCAHCLQAFSTAALLSIHCSKCTSFEPSQETIRGLAKKSLLCEICKKAHPEIINVMECYSKQGLPRCIFCLMVFVSVDTLLEHLEFYHHGCSQRIVKCQFCPVILRLRKAMEHTVNFHYLPALKATASKEPLQRPTLSSPSQQHPSPISASVKKSSAVVLKTLQSPSGSQADYSKPPTAIRINTNRIITGINPFSKVSASPAHLPRSVVYSVGSESAQNRPRSVVPGRRTAPAASVGTRPGTAIRMKAPSPASPAVTDAPAIPLVLKYIKHTDGQPGNLPLVGGRGGQYWLPDGVHSLGTPQQ